LSGSRGASHPAPVTIVVAGGFGAGKVTFVGSAAEIRPLATEAVLTAAGTSGDDVSLLSGKAATTAAMDFGRITLESGLVLSLFGTPGQQRFWFIRDDTVTGAAVLAGTRRLVGSFPAAGCFESAGVPLVAGINRFGGRCLHHPGDVSEAPARLTPRAPRPVPRTRPRISEGDPGPPGRARRDRADREARLKPGPGTCRYGATGPAQLKSTARIVSRPRSQMP
jgi:uncharacterized protein